MIIKKKWWIKCTYNFNTKRIIYLYFYKILTSIIEINIRQTQHTLNYFILLMILSYCTNKKKYVPIFR